ncbi:ABC transporter substrate-binding protein [Clostridium psychrophilum]|uniref:ABC transporter substrate-binding protein n=1 Tax=Clostridium psychrophilum TaxID=132926 RepID=UPI001C0D18F3|nr:ABC transporter substrate-binding protein [Clostridium psychrophilum]MBU3180186.1 ABC transporter substrate-binding protein [Clostridium psychrophilum]
MKKRKILCLITTLALTMSMFTGCGSSGKTTKGSENVTIKVGYWSSSPSETTVLNNQIASLTKKYPNIKIQKQVITGDYNQALQAQIGSKTEPDVFYMDSSVATSYMAKGVLLPIDKYLDKNDTKDFQSNLLKGFQSKGKTYGLPKDYNTLALYYNKDMFSAAGITAPPTTWKELTTDAKKLTKGGVVGLSLADDVARFAPFIFQAGGKINIGDKAAFNTAEAAKGLDYYYSFFKNKTASDPKSLGDSSPDDSLANKHAAMVISGGWLIPSIAAAAPDVKYGIAKLPKGEKSGDLAFTVGYVMGRDTKHPKEAAEVMKYLTSKEAQTMTANTGLAIPSRKSMGNVFASKFPQRKALVDMTKDSQVYNFGLNSQQIVDALTKAGEELRLGKFANGKAALENAYNSIK